MLIAISDCKLILQFVVQLHLTNQITILIGSFCFQYASLNNLELVVVLFFLLPSRDRTVGYSQGVETEDMLVVDL